MKRSLVQQIQRTDSSSGTLPQGELLPGVRTLAADLSVSIITTRRAYEELERDGYIKTLPGRGSIVSIENREHLLTCTGRRCGAGWSGLYRQRRPRECAGRKFSNRSAGCMTRPERRSESMNAIMIQNLKKNYGSFEVKAAPARICGRGMSPGWWVKTAQAKPP